MARIRVKLKGSNQTGTVEQADFNPKTMVMVAEASTFKKTETPQPAKKDEGILKTLASPFVKTGKRIAGAGYEVGRAARQAAGEKNVYYDPKTRETKQNPFLTEEELKPENVIKSTAKSTAGLASFAVPFGKGSGFLQKALFPGASVGVLSGMADEKNTNPFADAASGAVGAGVLRGAGNIVGAGKRAVANAVSDRAAQGLTKATPSTFTKAVQEHGIDLNAIIKKHIPGGSNYEKLVGEPTERGFGGVVSKKILEREDVINKELDRAGKTIRISPESLVSGLKKELKDLKVLPGNEEKVKGLQSIISETQKLYKNGITAKGLLQIKRAADNKFGKAVVEEQTGSVASSAQKMIGNTARKLLKDTFQNIKEALDDETELITLREVLNRARGIANTQGSTIRTGGLGGEAGKLLNPLTYTGAAFNNPRIASTLAKAGGKAPTDKVSVRNNLLSQLAARSGMLGGEASQNITEAARPEEQPEAQEATTALADGQLSEGGQWKYNASRDDWEPAGTGEAAAAEGAGVEQLSTRRIQEEMLFHFNQTGKIPKELETLYKLAKDREDEGNKTQKPMTESALSREQMGQLVDESLSLLENDPGIKTGLIGGPLESLKGKFSAADQDTLNFNVLVSNLQATIAKARGGTSFTPNEQAMLEKYSPKVGDSRQELLTKLKALKKIQFNKETAGRQTIGNEDLENVVQQYFNYGR